MVDQINFNDDLGLFGATGTANLSGTLLFDYPNSFVDGSLTLSSFGGFGPQIFTSLKLTQTGTTLLGVPIYQLSGSNGVTGISIDYTGVTPTMADINVSDVSGTPVAALNGAVVQAAAIVCFAAGTRIRTRRGDIAIENLRVGEPIQTISGQWRPVVWTGSRTIDCRTYPEPAAVLPVKIAAGALGAAKPSRDLFVSPGHAICVTVLDEVLIPAALLVNGTTITQVDADTITYWHVELETHDIIIADGLATESYIDVGNRTFFKNGSGTFEPDAAAAALADYCRPYETDDAVVGAVRRRLRARAEALGWTLDETPLAGLHLTVDGEIVRPEVDGLNVRFTLPRDAADVWLVSDTVIPAHLRETIDRRVLGVCLRQLTIEADGVDRKVGAQDPLLCVGFHMVEEFADAKFRWTAGRARLPASFWHGSQGQIGLRIELAGPSLPRWVSPSITHPVQSSALAAAA